MKKTMKKSMVVTTIVMVLLLVVALSTATFAWYTAQSNVEVTQTWITSAAATSANLVLDNQPTTSASATNTTVDLTMANNTAIQPMQYNATAPTATTEYSDFINNFVTFTVASNKYASAPAKGEPALMTNVSSANASTGTSMYISNIGGSATAVNATITIGSYYKAVETPNVANIGTYFEKSGNKFVETEDTALDADKTYYTAETNDKLRVAIFVKVGDAEDAKLTYVGTWGNGTINTSEIEIGTAAVGDTVATANGTITALANSNAEIIPSLASMQSAEIKLVAWFEGDVLTNAFANGGADFSISFSGN